MGRVRVDDEPDRFIAIMDAAGIDAACINMPFMGEARLSNDKAAAFAGAHPDRLFFAAFVTPLYPEEVAPSSTERSTCSGPSSSRYIPTS